MPSTKIFIKNMVCNRCKMVVENELEKLGIHPVSVELGEVILEKELSSEQKEKVKNKLQSLGFSLIDDKKSLLIEQIKTLIIELVHYPKEELKVNLSEYLSRELHHEYNTMSNLFTEVVGCTIEKYFIAQKIEKVKELLVYDELTLSEIADKLNYSSVAYLSNQFKKVTGFTPTHFKNVKGNKRQSIDKV